MKNEGEKNAKKFFLQQHEAESQGEMEQQRMEIATVGSRRRNKKTNKKEKQR